ncbi:hypothetical protein KUCAC02_032944 [Chaenocephalus aceratus]|nr:hypothetical protein KUCAC02_032944 [Chaenocephalus aceratus]
MAPTHVLRCCQRTLAWIPVIFIAAVVCWSYYAYVVELCLYTIISIGEKIIYMIFFHLFFIMFVWSYWKTIFIQPANPSKEFCLPKVEKERYEKEERPENQQEILWRAATTIRYCDRCPVIKPDRCHHCSACDMCVLKMDHHCPWVNNCVGFSNYKFFILFLAYSLLYCLFIAATVLQYFIKFWTKELKDTHAKAFRAPVFRAGSDKNGFPLGFRKNIAQVFGDQKKFWLLPVCTSQGDGLTFPTRLVSADVEQQATVTLQQEPSKSAAEVPESPVSESQNRLLSSEQNANNVAEHQDNNTHTPAESETITISIESES